MLVLVIIILIVYVILHDLLPRTHPPPRNFLERGSLADAEDMNRADRGGPQVDSSDVVRSSQAALPTKQEQATALGVTSGDVNFTATTIASTDTLSSIGSSFVTKFGDLKVNTPHPHFASPAGASLTSPGARLAPGSRPWSLSPLSTPPHSPTPSPAPALSSDSTGFLGQPLGDQSAIDFSLYKKKIHAVTKSPQKAHTKAAGKLCAEFTTDATTITTWFYKLSTNPELVVVPPNLTGHPEGLSLGNLYFDSAGGVYQLWFWCSDKAGVAHWKKIPLGYERGDGKRLIVTPKNHLLSWVTPSYYKQLASGNGSTKSDD